MTTSSKKSWWYAIGQNRFGPCSSSELIDLVAQGKLFPDSLVWKEGMADWVPASRVKGLWQKLPATPPLESSTLLPDAQAQAPAPAAAAYGATPAQPAQFGGSFAAPAAQQADAPASAWPEDDDEEELPPREEMTFKTAVTRCFKKYIDFSGRASRAEYWYFFLFNFSLAFVLGLLAGLHAGMTGADESPLIRLVDFYQLAILLPSTAVATRRLHDIGRSGWWQLIVLTGIGAFVLLYWLIKQGDDGANEYGYPE